VTPLSPRSSRRKPSLACAGTGGESGRWTLRPLGCIGSRAISRTRTSGAPGPGARAHERARADLDYGAGGDDAVALRVVVASLPPRERDAIVARFYLGMSVRETAGALECPEGTVKTLTHRAIARLRDAGFVDEEIIDA
jgi:DNA-directed RNA polymerase specialized sigma24 family protein